MDIKKAQTSEIEKRTADPRLVQVLGLRNRRWLQVNIIIRAQLAILQPLVLYLR